MTGAIAKGVIAHGIAAAEVGRIGRAVSCKRALRMRYGRVRQRAWRAHRACAIEGCCGHANVPSLLSPAVPGLTRIQQQLGCAARKSHFKWCEIAQGEVGAR